MKKVILSLLVLTLLCQNVGVLLAQKKRKKQPVEEKKDNNGRRKNKKGVLPYDQVITSTKTQDEGLFATHMIDDKLYFEIPSGMLEKDMLLVSRVSKLPAGFGGGFLNAGSKVNEQVIRWYKRNDHIDLKVLSFNNVSDESLPIYESVQNNSFAPILFSFPIKTVSPDSNNYVIDASPLFTKEVASINGVFQAFKKRNKIKNLDRSRSYIEGASSYPYNVEVKHVMTYMAEASKDSRVGAVSMLMNQSMILLPEERMQPRQADKRVGWFTVKKIDYGSDLLKADEKKYIRRWRLIPKDIDAYSRGELVEPVKPIVYYIDPATPDKWRKYFKQGVEDWNVAFEAAGFKNAIIAKDPPSLEEDPEFSPEDIRYSVIRYVASTTRNPYGPSVSDPRTGEILESDIMWYHNHLRSYRNRFMIEAGAQNPDARTLDIPEKEIGEMIRMVIAHEVGHTLGLPHNMKASSAYPVDSLRSATFTQKMGLTPSIMDYARVNYVAQPEDKGVRYIRMLGPYDIYAINWGYRFIPEANSSEGELPTLNKWIGEKEGQRLYEFGGGSDGIDPRSQRESLGDDNIKASEYGIYNLKKVVPNLASWTAPHDREHEDLAEVYQELTILWRGYLSHVTTNIGGVYETHKTSLQKGVVYQSVPKEIQQKALIFLNTHAFKTPSWLLDQNILGKIESTGAMERIRQLQVSVLNDLLKAGRLLRVIENEGLASNGKAYGLVSLVQGLRKGIWEEIYGNQIIDPFRRNLQRGYIERMDFLLNQKVEKGRAVFAEKGVDFSQSDIKPVVRGELVKLRKDIKVRLGNVRDTITQYHLEYTISRIDEILDKEG